MTVQLVFGLENIALNGTQKQALIDALRALQAPPGKLPHVMHIRIRNDSNAALFEALVDEDWLTIDALKQYLANVFGVQASDITHQLVTPAPSYGGYTTTVVRLFYQSTERVRVALFGGQGATYEESYAEARGYLILNKAQWELL